jgi:YebC/PmpR family DNA-binding regulatory protein
MSGHSKWATIKRKKGSIDAARGKIFTKLAREVQVAARGGADINMNFALRLAVEKAKAENMPKDNIDRAIRRGAGLEKGAAEFESVLYEGYAAHGVAVLIDCLTDNRNRAISDLRYAFNRYNGSLGEPGSVAWQFASKGYIAVNLVDDDGEKRKIDPDEVFMIALELGAEDVHVGDDAVEIYTERADLATVTQGLKDSKIVPDSAELTMKPNTTLELSSAQAMEVMDLVNALEEIDDVNQVYHNLELTDELVAQLA